MTLCTGRGGKLFVSCEDAFALMSRIPRTNRMRVIEDAEMIWKFPGFFAYILSIAVACIGNVYLFAAVIPASYLAYSVVVRSELIIKPGFGLIRIICRLYALFTGYGLFVGFCIWLSYHNMGWGGVCAYLGSNAVRIFIDSRVYSPLANAVDAIRDRDPSKIFEVNCFLLAYKRMAKSCAADPSLIVHKSKGECERGDVALSEFMVDWPRVYANFLQCEGLPLNED